MSVFNCKMCGSPLNILENNNIVECEYCNTKQTVPVIKTEEVEALYERANYFFHNNEYDKAANVYENISIENPYDPESYFMLALCKYGIEYVEDPSTKKMIPTLHRLHFESIIHDVNFKKAIKHADSSQKILYEQEAKYIDEVRNKILDISKKEKPYDVFICYKETDEKGQRTEDSVLAMDIYNELTKEGLKVFFAKKTLESKLGIDYEPYIFAALNSVKVMIVVGTKPEYINSPWVRNEWSRFLDRINTNKLNKKNVDQCYIVPAYKGMSPYALPDAFSSIQSQDMAKEGATQDLVGGIKKLINRKTENNVVNKSNKKWGMLAIVGVLGIVILAIVLIFNTSKTVVIRNENYVTNKSYGTITLDGINDFGENDVSQLKKLKSIDDLYFKDCSLDNLNFLSELKNVKGVRFYKTVQVKDYNITDICENIESFKIIGNKEVIWDSLECIKSMPNLKVLEIPLCDDLSPVSNHNKLIELNMFSTLRCKQINDFLWCDGLDKLEKLTISNYTTLYYALSDNFFNGIENLSSLKYLQMQGSAYDSSFPQLSQTNIEHISELKALEALYIGIFGLTESGRHDGINTIELKYLQKMNHLKVLYLYTCNQFDLTGIGDLNDLENLSLIGASDILNDDLRCLNGLNKLKDLSLNLTGAYIYDAEPRKFSLKGIENLPNIKNFYITGSGEIEILDEDLARNKSGLNFQNGIYRLE